MLVNRILKQQQKLLKPPSFQELKTYSLRIVGCLFCLLSVFLLFLGELVENLLTDCDAFLVLYKWFCCLGCDLIHFLHSFGTFVFVVLFVIASSSEE